MFSHPCLILNCWMLAGGSSALVSFIRISSEANGNSEGVRSKVLSVFPRVSLVATYHVWLCWVYIFWDSALNTVLKFWNCSHTKEKLEFPNSDSVITKKKKSLQLVHSQFYGIATSIAIKDCSWVNDWKLLDETS